MPSHSRRPSSPTLSTSTSLTLDTIAGALLRSEDAGQTLDFGHLGLTDVGEDGAEELATQGRESLEEASTLHRINLGSNKLATLPMAFALLSSLRYLNLRNNSFSVFPDVLTLMPSLEVLEIGRNKIKRLPSQPGSLVNLRVLSIYKNKITRLPSYFTQFHSLEVLKCEQNPLEWPPKHVIDAQGAAPDFVSFLKRWMLDPLNSDRKRSLDDVSESPTDDDGRTPHARSFSVSSDYTPGSMPPIPVASSSSSSSRHRPLHLKLPASNASSASVSPNRSPDSYLPTPDESVSSTDDELYKEIEANLATDAHVRTSSYSGPQGLPAHPRPQTKKSLPDMRPPLRLRSHDDLARFPPLAESPVAADFGSFSRRANRSLEHVAGAGGLPSPVSNRQDSAESDYVGIARPPASRRHYPREPSASASASASTSASTSANSVLASANSPTAYPPVQPVDEQRNRYFRRFSARAPAARNRALPEPLLQLVDAIRGLLFACSQVHQQLQHYAEHALDDRLASILLKVLDPAGGYIRTLISALDRFDGRPSTGLTARNVVDAARDCAAACGKAVGVLSLQLKVLAASGDDRYTRQMLLGLYGAAAEIGLAWGAIAPALPAVEPLLRGTGASTQSISVSTSSSSIQAHSRSNSNGISDLAPPRAPFAGGERHVHVARRHAGSFSFKDVEIGRALPSIVSATGLAGGLATAADTPTPRAGLRSAGYFSPRSHMRADSGGSSAGYAHGPGTPDTPRDLGAQVDRDAISAMARAAAAAPPIWVAVQAMLDEDSSPTDETGEAERDELRALLDRAQSATEKLAEGLNALESGHGGGSGRGGIRETAHLFGKSVVQLSGALRGRNVNSQLRADMVTLTNATEELVILLHVSSFAPRAYTPSTPSTPHHPFSAMPGSRGGGNDSGEDTPRLGASLSRSRSAATQQSRIVLERERNEGPRSALPMQGFRVNGPPTSRGIAAVS
ncbi:hypothetical protein PENSPDRAFT_493463 [Peniophora sp. CONT]|nr:hypothetical protein PENSPDRAFT_493463 [Peniophora sp. CONT]